MSCTLRISVPLFKAIVFKTDVPFSALLGLVLRNLYIIDFLDIPTNNGFLNSLNFSKLLKISKL